MDETLIWSDKAHILAFNQAFVAHGLKAIPYKRFEKELNGDETILILKRLYPQLSPKEIKKIREEKKENIIHDTVKYVKVIPGVIKTLKILKKRGYELAIISNCRHAEIITILKYAKLSIKLFDKIIGKDEVRHPKPYPDEIFKAERLLHHKVDFMVGDSLNDIKAAKRAKVEVISVASGNVSKAKLRKAKPNHLILHLSEMLKIVK